MKAMSGKVDIEATDFRIIFPGEPEMEGSVTIPLFGSGVVTGLNDNYMGLGQSWVMVRWSNGDSTQFEYKVSQ